MTHDFGSDVLPERFWKHAEVDASGCWRFSYHQNKGGYGQYYYRGRTRVAHRVAWELLVGPIPEGLTLDHLCRVRSCVNPSHLEVVTMYENMMRGVGPTARNARKTHCIYGHEFTPENTRRTREGKRVCRICGRERQRAFRDGLAAIGLRPMRAKEVGRLRDRLAELAEANEPYPGWLRDQVQAMADSLDATEEVA